MHAWTGVKVQEEKRMTKKHIFAGKERENDRGIRCTQSTIRFCWTE